MFAVPLVSSESAQTDHVTGDMVQELAVVEERPCCGAHSCHATRPRQGFRKGSHR